MNAKTLTGLCVFLFAAVLVVAHSGCANDMKPEVAGTTPVRDKTPVPQPPSAAPVFVPPALGGKTGKVSPFQTNMVVILDASGSMRGRMYSNSPLTRMEVAKTALTEVLKGSAEDTSIGLLVFGAKNLPNGWAYPLAHRHDATLKRAIEYAQPFYGTPLGAFIKKGADRLLAQRAKQEGYGTYRLLIVTDGEATDPALLEKYVPEVLARGIRIDVVGVAMETAHTLATKVHSYRNAYDTESCKRALAQAIAEVDKPASDVTSAAAFDEIAPLPEPLVRAALKALCESPNHPIGEKP